MINDNIDNDMFLKINIESNVDYRNCLFYIITFEMFIFETTI